MAANEIRVILENEEKKVLKDASIKKMLKMHHNRYLVLQLKSREICFMKLTLNENGIPELEDINDENEFNYVEQAFAFNTY
ncbi:DUF1292 domain-containing protein [Peribacillus loiseleuriae]|uniref:DUF1292 domain-containing protein n=1 Tax=Peribacillus loiseleuriae TaxID=1679170 RepID=UPI003CFC2567